MGGPGGLSLLLDTHALLWFWLGDTRLPGRARSAIAEAGVDAMVSAISGLEITTKHRIGKLPGASSIAERFEALVLEEGFTPLPVSVAHAALAGRLTIPHGDPFDRVLIAQSLIERIPLVSNERLFDAAGVSRIWSSP